MATLDTLLSMLESIEDDLTELTDDDIAELLGDRVRLTQSGL
jgi:hypothetical protein